MKILCVKFSLERIMSENNFNNIFNPKKAFQKYNKKSYYYKFRNKIFHRKN
jgi:hypothetical protein